MEVIFQVSQARDGVFLLGIFGFNFGFHTSKKEIDSQIDGWVVIER